MQWHLHYHPLPLSGDVEQRARENGEPNEMDNLCLAFVRWPCSAGVRVFVCFNYKSLFIVAELRQEQAAATRRHRKRVRCNILYCFLGTARFAGVYGFFALPFAITTIVVSTIFFFHRPSATSTDSFPFHSIAGCSFTRRQHVFFISLFLSSILLLFGICLA